MIPGLPAPAMAPAPGGAYYIPAPAMAPAMAPTPQTEETKSQKKIISRSVATVQKIPKCHQVDGVTAIEASLDSTLSGKCDQDELAVMVWILTRIKPNFKISDLRCEYYEDIYELYKSAASRLRVQNRSNYNLLLTKLHTFLAEDDTDNILVLAMEYGFDPNWLTPQKRQEAEGKRSNDGNGQANEPSRS